MQTKNPGCQHLGEEREYTADEEEKEDEKVPSIGEITSKSWSPKTSTISSDTSSSSGDLDIPTFLRKNKGK